MRTRNRLLFGGILPAALLALAGCSGSATASPGTGAASSNPQASGAIASSAPGGAGTGSLDASAILTPDAAASIIGGTPTLLPGSVTTGPLSIVSYTTATGDTVTIFVEAFPGGISQAALQASLQAAFVQQGASGQMQPVSGLGDLGGKSVTDHEATVAFVKGGTIVVLTATSSTMAGTDIDAKLEALAQQIIGKL